MVLIKGAHSVTECIYHFTFIPKYRRSRLVGQVKQKLSGMIKFCAQVNDWKILELIIEPEHVHLVIQAQADDSPSSIMQAVKGGTSRKLKELFPNLAENIWGKKFWSDGYFAETVGVKDLHQLNKYLHDGHHLHGVKLR